MKMERNPPYRSEELIRERKIISDERNDTDDLNFGTSDYYKNDYFVCHKIRNLIDQNEIDALSSGTDESDMLKELDKLEQEFIDNE